MDSLLSEIQIDNCSQIFEEAICRLCASRSQQTVNVFDEEVESLDLINTISQCLQIKICSNDCLPKDICLTCCEKLREYFQFYTLCSLSQKSLTELYSTNSPRRKTPLARESLDEHEEILIPSSPDAPQPKGSKKACKRKLRKPLRIVREPIIIISDSQAADNNTTSDGVDLPTLEQTERVRTSSIEEINQTEAGDESRITTKKLFENYVWKCCTCDADLHSLSELKMHHQKVHKQPVHFKCMKCDKIYTRYRSFVRHMIVHNGSKRFVCETCGKRFSQKTILQTHMTVHTEERPHVCPQCGKAFKQFSSLYLHSKSHLPEQAKPKFHCAICKKMFSSKNTLENHTKIHTGEKDFICAICGKGFIAKGSLNYHILSHNEAKNHQCSLCKKTFKTPRLLAKHSSLHSGVKPHQCDVCGKQFRERGALKEHVRIHTGEMPYVCEYCGKAFRFKGILTVHIRQHTGERPYRCIACSRSFTNWANHNKHMQRRHNQSGLFSSPPSISLPSVDFGDPCDLPLSADSLNIQDFVVDHEIFKIPSTQNSFDDTNCYNHFQLIPSENM